MKRKKNRMDMLAQQILAMQEELEEVNKPESESEQVEGLSELLWRFQFISPQVEMLVDLEEANTVEPVVATRKPVLERPTEEVHTNNFSTLPYRHCIREQKEKFHNNRFHFLFSVILQFHIADCFHTERTYLPYLG